MGAIDIKSRLASVMPDSPCGPDLRKDNAYIDLGAATLEKPRFDGKNEIVEEPNWTQVWKLAEDLLARSKDLRVTQHWMRALVHLDFVGWKLHKTVAADLRSVYTAATASEVETRLTEFEAQWNIAPRFW